MGIVINIIITDIIIEASLLSFFHKPSQASTGQFLQLDQNGQGHTFLSLIYFQFVKPWAVWVGGGGASGSLFAGGGSATDHGHVILATSGEKACLAPCCPLSKGQ